MRQAFTLIEMLISVVILSIMMLFLYESYAALNRSNVFYKEKATVIKDNELKKRILYLDFSVALNKSVRILNQDNNEDIVYMQSANSLHKRYNPYVAYIAKDEKLYRLESLKEFREYPFGVDTEFEADYMGEIDSFRVYKSNKSSGNNTSEIYLVHIKFKKEDEVLLKIKVLNEY